MTANAIDVIDQTTLPLTRAQAMARLNSFAPHAGSAYAARRNYDNGPGRHDAVSRLSAALRRRVIGEDEVVRAVLARHTPAQSEKFISEVFWRTYWKGWLEQRPAVWSDYVGEVAQGRDRAAQDPALADNLHMAMAGTTGIDCFDHWVRELIETGYLHNWSRMQFASIWVFTLRLPWALGAAFTLQHFTDGDAASNTLSWRWVAGLHTAGKTYLADAERITSMTGGRFAPRGLATTAMIPPAKPTPAAQSPRAARPWLSDLQTLVMLTPEDLSLETLPMLATVPVKGIVAPRSLFSTAADQLAGEDALQRASTHWQCNATWVDTLADVTDCAAEVGATQVLTGFAPIGPVADALDRWATSLAGQKLAFGEVLRGWDVAAWPHCRRGFFALKEKIPQLISGIIQPELFPNHR